MKHLTDAVDKSQLTVKDTERELHEWVDQSSVRQIKKLERLGIDDSVRDIGRLNYLPAGSDITNQANSEQNPMRLISSIDSGTEGPLTQKDRDRGYKRGVQSSTEESRDDYPEFYGEVTGENDGGDKITGFLERRNVGDRN